MNDRQRKTLIIAAVVTVLMLVFPPWEIALPGATLDKGYSFILLKPTRASSVNLSQLLVQWLAVWVVTGIALAVRRS